MLRDELPWIIGLFVAVVIAAALVNALRPQQRRRVRRLFVTYVLYAIAAGLAFAFHALELSTWTNAFVIVRDLMHAYLIVTLVAMLLFTVVLPTVSIELPLIASDLLVGFGFVIASLVVLAKNGMSPTNAVLSGAVISAVLVISLQSTLGNILGGVALQLDGSIQDGDWIQFPDGRVGRVRAVRWRHTVVETRDFATIIVPNAQLLAQSIVLLGKRDGLPTPARLAIPLNIDARFSPARVTEIITTALQAAPIENVADEPPPVCACVDMAKDTREGVIAYLVRYSILELAAEEATSSRVRARIYAALRREDIQIGIPAAVAFSDPTDESVQRRRARELDERLAVLRQVPLFQSLNEDELRSVAADLQRAAYAEGEMIFRQGAVASSLFILASGTVEIRTNVDPDGPGGEPERPIFVAKVRGPNYFGERGMMTGEPRSADVVAATDVDCYQLHRGAFQKVLLARPEIVQELSERLARRRVELESARDGLDATTEEGRAHNEIERVRRAITSFFGLSG